MKGIKLPQCKNKLLKENIEIFEPEKVYFKIDESDEILVEENETVLKNALLASSENQVSIVSSVSGKVIEIDEYIVIQNDFKEQTEVIDIEHVNHEKFISLLKDSGITGMGGGGFPTYLKYSKGGIKTLLVNAIECEPYITADYQVMKTYFNEVLEAIKKIMSINKIEKCVIGIKKSNHIIEKVFKEENKIIIKKVKNIYPVGWERSLIKAALNIDYQKLPIEKGIVVNNISTIYAIGRLLKGERLTSRIVTISGDIDKPVNYHLKMGTKIEEVLKKLNIKKELIVIGGPMMGKLYTNQIVNPCLNGILLLDKQKETILPCLRCGKCIEVCPSHLEPVLIKDCLNDSEKLKKLNPKKCIECGLCSYICPSKIKLRDRVIEAKEKVK